MTQISIAYSYITIYIPNLLWSPSQPKKILVISTRQLCPHTKEVPGS
uniref:Uncharacterized protein n=1 Tax=Arundo donax TaxID=35708 RepID=A0A0A8XQP3_ARUDO